MADIKYLDKTGLTTVKSILDGLFATKGHAHSKGEIGLGNVDNTADKDKNVKYATSAGYADDSNLLDGKDSAYFDTAPFSTIRDFTLGTLIKTDINYNVTSGDPFYVEIKGNTYVSPGSMHIQIQGYIYNDTIINYSVTSLGVVYPSEIIAKNVGGYLCFWFPRIAYWHGYYIKVTTGYNYSVNRVTDVLDSNEPSGTKRVVLTNTFYTNYSNNNLTVSGGGASGGSSLSIKTNSTTYSLTIPTSLPASDVYSWAKAATKPSYNAGEVGALPFFKLASGNANDLSQGLTTATATITNQEGSNHSAFLTITDIGTPFQLQIPDSSINYIYKRYKSGSTWSAWTKLSAGYADTAGSAVDQTARNAAAAAQATADGKSDAGHTHTELSIESISDPNLAYSDQKLKYYLIGSTSSGAPGYAGKNYGFPVAHNANSILWLGNHSGNFGGQLGISGNGYLYYRCITSGSFPTDANGASWQRLAYISDFTGYATQNWVTGLGYTTATGHNHDSAYAPKSHGTHVPGIKSASSISTLGWSTNSNYVPDLSMLAYWNGAYSGTSSNLTYCANGTIIGSNNIGSQSVNYANTAGSAVDQTARDSAASKWTWNADEIKAVKVNNSGQSSITHYTSIGTSSDTHDSALKNFFNSNKNSIPRNALLGLYSNSYGNGSYYMGYWLSGYDTNPYGGFYVAHYNTPYYVGIVNGSYSQQKILTSTNYTDYVAPKEHTHDYAASTHSHNYLPLSGGTLTGSLTFANGTWNVVGDDAAIGDYNSAGMLGLKSVNNNIPGIGFHNSSGTLLGSLKCDAGILKWNDTTISLNGHGNHVPATQTASNKVFLRNDNTWQTITPANIGAAAASHGTHVTTGAQTWSGVKTFSSIINANSGVRIGSTDDIGWYPYNSRICAGLNVAQGVNAGSLLVSNAWADSSNVPTNGIYSKGNITSAGKINAASGFFDTSDERLKDFYDDIDFDFDKLRSIPKKYFTWKSDKNKEIHLGTSAQAVKEIYPEIVSEDTNGTLSVSYNKLSIVALAAVDKLYDENQELKSKISAMEERLAKLEKLLEV